MAGPLVLSVAGDAARRAADVAQFSKPETKSLS
jgi:hypothetical protein